MINKIGKKYGRLTIVDFSHKDKIVHHKNGVRNDNRIENLELRITNNHIEGCTIEDKIEDAIRILKLYAPEYLSYKQLRRR